MHWKEYTQPELAIATHQCPECFTDWGTQWVLLHQEDEAFCVNMESTPLAIEDKALRQHGKSEADAASGRVSMSARTSS